MGLFETDGMPGQGELFDQFEEEKPETRTFHVWLKGPKGGIAPLQVVARTEREAVGEALAKWPLCELYDCRG